jgi:hypothetical protein
VQEEDINIPSITSDKEIKIQAHKKGLLQTII